ncbi:MAG: rhodanese-like domain-containing protein [Betaproteobacteria bacterium]
MTTPPARRSAVTAPRDPPQKSPQEVHALLDSSDEWAFLDVREQGAFDEGHPFWAVNAPASHLESEMPRLVPRKGTLLVLMDDSDGGLARQAAERLSGWGYDDIAVMRGGLQAWREAGLPVYAGIHVPSKAFGEFVEHHEGTPSIDVQQLKDWTAQGRDMLVLDCRPFEEFQASSLPGSMNCPGVDLVSRIFDLVQQDSTTVVVHCAGRTRGIIGAQSLINAGIANPVVTLRNGMADWVLSGESLAKGNRKVAPPATPQGTDRALQAAERLSRRFGVRTIDAPQLQRLQADPARTLYLFDVRTPEEYEAGHLADAQSAPGGQLVQTLDAFVGTRGSRIVLCDDTGVRARVAASWLVQMGWKDVFVLEHGWGAAWLRLERGPSAEPMIDETSAAPALTIDILELRQGLERGDVVLLDLTNSLQFSRQHIPGAWFAVRARMREALSRVPPHRLLVLTCPDGKFAGRAHADAQALSAVPVAVLKGGNAAWSLAGWPMTSGRDQLTTTTDDIWYSPIDRPDPMAAIHAYLAWEVGLVDRLSQERGVQFQHIPDTTSSTT